MVQSLTSMGDLLLNKAASAAREIMNSGLYELHTTGDPANDYYNTFNWRDFTNNPETMRWTKMDLSQEISAGRKLFYFAYPETRGLTKQFVDQYLAIDGLPISVSPLY